MSADEILKLAKKLDKVIAGTKSEEYATDILNVLKSTPMTLEVLQKTRIGMTVNELRKRVQSKEIQSEAKSLIKVWKKLLDSKDKDKAPNSSSFPRIDSTASNMSIDSSSNDVPDGAIIMSQDSDQDSMQINNTNDVNFQNNINVKSDRPMVTKPTLDEVRNKSRELLLKSLTHLDLPEDSLDPEQLATEIELCIYDLFSSTNEKYRAAIRSRVFNLRDKKNPELRENVLLGGLKPERLAKMTPEEMASQEMKDLRKTMTKQAIDDHQVSQETGTASDMFQCGKCRGKNCTYTQVQTRSADEPMTTFVWCRSCGNRWKFC